VGAWVGGWIFRHPNENGEIGGVVAAEASRCCDLMVELGLGSGCGMSVIRGLIFRCPNENSGVTGAAFAIVSGSVVRLGVGSMGEGRVAGG
jgi:hypothetical protein